MNDNLNCLISFKCDKCGSTLEYCKGIENYTDFVGCPNRDNCNFKNIPANAAIMFLRKQISKNKN